MIQHLSYIHFLSFCVYLFLAVFVIIKNRRSSLNRACSAMLLCFSVWSFGVTFVNNPFVSMATAVIFENIGAIGWTFFSGFFFWFTLIFTEEKRLLRSKPLFIAIFLPPVIILFQQFSGNLIHDYMLKSFGWIGKWSNSIWTYAFFSYYLSLTTISLILTYIFRNKTEAISKKRQAEILLLSSIFPLIIGSFFNVWLRQMNVYKYPPIGDVFILVWAIGMSYAITKYKFMSITPFLAAENIISTMSDILLLLDTDGNIVTFNRAALDQLKYDKEKLEGMPLGAIITDDLVRQEILGSITKGEIRNNFEVVLKTGNAGEIPVSFSTSALPGTGVVCIARDITLQKKAKEALQKSKTTLETEVEKRTKELSSANKELTLEIKERKKIEEDLRESEEKFKMLFEFAPDAYYINDLSGTFIDGNKKAEEITGYKREELINKSFLKLNLLPSSLLPKAAKLLALNALDQPTGPDEFRLTRKDGSSVDLEIITFPMKIDKKRCVIGIARDITKRKQTEEKMLEGEKQKAMLEDQLRQAQKMEAIGLLAGGIAHDFNNALGAIAGYADMIKMKFGNENPKLNKYADVIFSAAKRASDLTVKLLTFARKENTDFTTINIHEIIGEAIILLQHTIEKNITINTSLDADNPYIKGDRNQIQNVIMNLSINARDAMPGGGTLSIVTDVVDYKKPDDKQSPSPAIPLEYLRCIITDTGVGMSEEIKSRIFEPFFTTKEPGRGTGLGLASVYGIVKSHNGHIEVRSEPSKGTSFEIYLPLTIKSIGKSDHDSDGIQRGSGSILLIDDEKSVTEMCSEIFTELGYSVAVFEDPALAIGYYSAHFREIDLVIMDMIMPKIPGTACFAELKKINPDIKILVLSGYLLENDIQKILEQGALGFIQKPFDFRTLSKEINNLLNSGPSV